jgi:hypothetical protein
VGSIRLGCERCVGSTRLVGSSGLLLLLLV